jgi:hypothetical protein
LFKKSEGNLVQRWADNAETEKHMRGDGFVTIDELYPVAVVPKPVPSVAEMPKPKLGVIEVPELPEVTAEPDSDDDEQPARKLGRPRKV